MEITPGNLVDQLAIINIRIWFLEDIKRKPNATDREIAEATKKVNQLNPQRAQLIEAIDKAHGIITGQGATKMYGKK